MRTLDPSSAFFPQRERPFGEALPQLGVFPLSRDLAEHESLSSDGKFALFTLRLQGKERETKKPNPAQPL